MTSVNENKKYIAIANSNEHWQQTKASFALEGIILTQDDDVIAGRRLAGEITLEQAHAEVLAKICLQGGRE